MFSLLPQEELSYVTSLNLSHPTTSHYSTLELSSSPSRSASRLRTKHFPVTGRSISGPTRSSFSAEIIEKPDNPYVRVALEIGLYGTGTHGSVREARERTSKRTREKNVDESRDERVEAQGERSRVRFRTLWYEYLAFCNVAYLL